MSKEQENLRQKFIDDTNHKLWAEDFNEDVGFSDKYVEWLEKQLLLYNVVGQSEQFVCDCTNEEWVYDESGVDMYCKKCEPKK